MVGLGLAICTVASTPGVAGASPRSCSPEDEAAADASYDRLNSWARIETMFSRFRQCDDGGIAEGNSEAVARMLVDHWDTLPELEKLTRREPGFRHWVLEHIDSTLDVDDLHKLDQHAKLNCPPRYSALCKDLRQAVAEAINDE